MQSATNLIEIGHKIRKLEFENQNSDIYLDNEGRHFEYLIHFLLILKSQ